MSEKMQSVEYKLLNPFNLILDEILIEWPPKKSPGVLCRTRFSGISPGTEIAAWSGQKKLRPTADYPRKVGYQNISEVIDISGEIQGIKIGDLVYTNQGHTSHFRCDPSEILAVLPDEYEVRKQLFAYMYHLGLSAISARTNTEEILYKLSVFGAGALGMSVIEIAELLGLSSTLVTDVARTSEFDEVIRRSVSREKFKKNSLDSDSRFQQCIITTNSWEDYSLGLSTLDVGGSLTLLGFPGRDGTLPSVNPFSPELFYVNNLSVLSTPSLRKDLLNSRSETLSLRDSITEIVDLISKGKLGRVFDNVEIFSYLELARLYGEIESRGITALTAGINWSLE